MRRASLVRAAAFAVACLSPLSAAHAVCSAANTYNFSFASQAAATLNYANTYTYTATSTALGSQNFTVSFAINGTTSTVVGGNQMPNISNMITDGVAARNLAIGAIFSSRTPAGGISGTTRVIRTTFTFPQPVRDVALQVNDIDFATNQYRDWFYITAANGATTYDPVMTTPYGNTNAVAGPKTAVNSTLAFGATATPVSLTTVREAVGSATSGNNANNGTIFISFAQPVTSVTLHYGNYPLQSGETATGQQAYGVQSVAYCPMPLLTVAKSSAPYVTTAGDPLRFAAPGSDLLYTLTVTNSNSSPVDVNSAILTDVLANTLTFRNLDFDDAGPITTNFEFLPGTSGLTLAAGNVTYSNNGGTSYGYAPASGYDTAVNALRIAPAGTMAANSSFTVRFRARVR